jgi:hypothetical protein
LPNCKIGKHHFCGEKKSPNCASLGSFAGQLFWLLVLIKDPTALLDGPQPSNTTFLPMERTCTAAWHTHLKNTFASIKK